MTDWASIPRGMRCVLVILRGKRGWVTAGDIRARSATLDRLEKLGLAVCRVNDGRTEWRATNRLPTDRAA